MNEEIGSIDWAAVISAAASSPLGIMALVIIMLSIMGYLMLRGTSEHYRFIAFLLLFFGGVALGMSIMSERDNFIQPDADGVIATITTGPPVVSVSEAPPLPSALPVEDQTRELSFSDKNAHCASPKAINWRVNAADGWSIDVRSIEVKVTVKSTNSRYIGVNDASSRGFSILGRLINNGDCIRAFGNVVAKDGRGALNVVASFREVRSDSE